MGIGNMKVIVVVGFFFFFTSDSVFFLLQQFIIKCNVCSEVAQVGMYKSYRYIPYPLLSFLSYYYPTVSG